MVVDMEVVMVAEMEVDKVVNKVTYEKEEEEEILWDHIVSV